MSGTAAPDPRVEMVARAEWSQAEGKPWREWNDPRIWRDSAGEVLAAADAAAVLEALVTP